jgi:ABC-type transport system involved in multi-copper enzyme maturation permease subunit
MLQSGLTDTNGVRIEGLELADAEAFLSWPLSFAFVQAAIMAVGPFLVIVLAGAVTAQEYGWRSFQLWLSRGVGRLIVLPAKMTAVSFTTLFLVSTAILLGGIISGLLSLWLVDSLPFELVHWGYLLLSVLAVTLALLPYAALALLLAVLSRSTAVTIGVGLAFVALVEPLISQLLPVLGERWAEVAAYLPGALGQSLTTDIVTRVADSGAAFSGLVSPGAAVIGLIFYVAGLLVASIALFQRQNLGG